MSKRKNTATDDTATTPLSDDERQRALYVLRSQGRAVGCFDSLPVEMQHRLAELVGVDGLLVPGVVQTVQRMFADYYHEMKATVDDEASVGHPRRK